MRRIVASNIEDGTNDPVTSLCTYEFTSQTGVRTDLVVGPWQQALGPLESFNLPNHSRESIYGLGDRATFLKAKTIDDGNSVIVVTSGRRSLFLGSEFLTRKQAIQLARLVVARWS